MADFAHLHMHSTGSLQDGLSRPDLLVAKIKDLKMDSFAITDHGNMHMVPSLYKLAKKNGLRFIAGQEMYVAPNGRFERPPKVTEQTDYTDKNYHHLTLLAKNYIGFKNLMKLSSEGFLSGFYGRPRVDRDLIEQYHEGIICLSGCLASEIQQAILYGDIEGAEKRFLYFKDLFGDDFYAEIHRHGLKEQAIVNPVIIEMAKKYNVPLIAANDAHYLTEEDAFYHDILLCFQGTKSINDTNRLRFTDDNGDLCGEFWVKPEQSMKDLFSDIPEAITNTVAIVEKCEMDIGLKGDPSFESHLPSFGVEQGQTPSSALRRLCRLDELSPEYRDRAEMELEVISKMGFDSYFLIVRDYVVGIRDSAEECAGFKKLPIGDGRGSVGGSLVANLLGITNVDPIRHNLPFERFLNPDRVTMPDIDIDFADKEEGIDYTKDRFGEENVVQIISLAGLHGKGAIRKVGSALDMKLDFVDKVAKMIPGDFSVELALRGGQRGEEEVEPVRELFDAYSTDPEVRRLVDIAIKFDGVYTHKTVHAAGVIITPEPAADLTALCTVGDKRITTQFTMEHLEDLGFLKMDLLSVSTVGLKSKVAERVAQNRGHVIDFADLHTRFDDPKTYELLSNGDTDGVFQVESSGMKEALRLLRPSTFDDIASIIALYRPGPMQNIATFVDNKGNPQNVRYLDPSLKDSLESTYGVIVYQEQVMQIARDFAGYKMSEADNLRRAMGKKKFEVIKAEEDVFIKRAKDLGRDPVVAKEIFDLLLKFANYGFNKAHAVGYGYLTYDTAYLKANYPQEFYAELLNMQIGGGSDSSLGKYIEDAKNHGIKVLRPDVNQSGYLFEQEGDNIRYGLAGILGVVKEAEKIIANRPYASLSDFIKRSDVNSGVIVQLIKAGALDSMGDRRTLLPRIELLKETGCDLRQKTLRQPTPISRMEMLVEERSVLGVFMSSNPLDELGLEKISEIDYSSPISTGIIIIESKVSTTKKGEKMARLTVEFPGGMKSECVVFPKAFDPEKIAKGNILMVDGIFRQDRYDEEKAVFHINTIKKDLEVTIDLSWVKSIDKIDDVLEKILSLVKKYPGNMPLRYKIGDRVRKTDHKVSLDFADAMSEMELL